MRLAVLIDAENIPASMARDVFLHVKELGTPVVKRVFGNRSALIDWAEAINTHQCKKFLQAKVSSAKNGTDIALAINAMDLLHRESADAFCVVSNDRDFIPLAKRLRAAGKQVHAICKRDDGRLEEIYNSVFEVEKPSRTDLIVEAFLKITADRGPELSLSEAGKLLRQHLPGVIPTSGKSPLRRALAATRRFVFLDVGKNIRVRIAA